MDKKPEVKEALESLRDAVLQYDSDAAKKAAQDIVAKGIDPVLAIKEVFGETANVLHARYDSGECFLPHLVMAGDAMTAAGEILEAAAPRDSIKAKKVVVIGTVEADLHSVGKTSLP